MTSENFIKEKKIISLFTTDKVISVEAVGHGNTNYTHVITLQKDDGTVYKRVLQKINVFVYGDAGRLMNNIYNITEFLKKQLPQGGNPDREVMTIVKSLNGNLYEKYEDEYYRCYVMIENSVSYQEIEKAEDFYHCGWAFADFQKKLSLLPADAIEEPIKGFHNTKMRFDNFIRAIEEDKMGRKSKVCDEIEFYLSRRHLATEIVDKLENNIIPTRIVHNDAKLNNMLFDSTTNKPLCILDLDTVMPGAACYDFGDAIRFGGTRIPAEKTGSATLDIDLFREFTKGYMSVAKDFLTREEIDTLAVSALVITYECGMRFLTDYLEGDVTFRIKYPDHNLDRTINHRNMVLDIEEKLPLMKQIVLEYAE